MDDDNYIEEIKNIFKNIEYLYIADGHHRVESSYKVGLKKRNENPNYNGEEGFNYILSVIFPKDELLIMPYNRLVKDLNGLRREEFIEKLEENFKVEKFNFFEEPKISGIIHMAFKDENYILTPKVGTYDKKIV